MASLIRQPFSADVHRRRLRGDEIRLVTLTSEPGAPITASLDINDLLTADFIAISYFWGSTASLDTITVNDRPYCVTRNVCRLLQVLVSSETIRQEDKPDAISLYGQKIWIDAITMNQEDEEEKAFQVNNMRSIYRQAKRTLIYLAPPENATIEDQALVVPWLQLLHESMTMEEWLRNRNSWQAFWNAEAYAATADMMHTPWFHRRWVIQEVAVSKDAWVLYGPTMMSWPAFSDAMEKASWLFSLQFNRPGFQIDGSMRPFDVKPLFAVCRLRQRDRGYRLLDLLTGLRRYNTSDRRDRIFGLLGLCHAEEAEANRANYGSDFSMQDVCLRFARSHILLYGDLDILCLAREEARIERLPGGRWHGHIFIKQSEIGLDAVQYLPDLPTWAPNLTSFYAEWLHGHETAVWRDRVDPYFDASRGRSAEVRNIAKLPQSQLLEVSGIIIDTVEVVQTNTPVPHPDWQNPHAIVFENIYQFTRQQCAYRNSRDRFTAFVRTMSTGGRRDGTRDFVNDQALRRYFLNFFAPSRFGRMLQQQEGLNEPEPATFADWYTDPEAGAKYSDNPVVYLTKLCHGVIAATVARKLALLPSFSQSGDKICVIFGCSSPIVLQPSPKHPGRSRVRGEAYIDGYMFGEAIRAWRNGELEKSTLALE